MLLLLMSLAFAEPATLCYPSGFKGAGLFFAPGHGPAEQMNPGGINQWE